MGRQNHSSLLKGRGARVVAQSVERPTSAQVTISWFVGSSPPLGSVLTAQSLEPASDSVSPSLSAPPLLTLRLSLSFKNKQTLKNKFTDTEGPATLHHGVTLCLVFWPLQLLRMGSRKAPALPARLPPGGQPGGGQLGLHGFVRKMLCVYTPGRMKTQTPFGKIALHGRFEPKCRQGGFIKKKKRRW